MIRRFALGLSSVTRRRDTRTGLLFVSPGLVGLVAFYGLPIIASGFYSFTDFNLFQSPTFVGWSNYATLLQDDRFYQSLFNTLYLTGIYVAVGIPLALALALLLNLRIRGQALYRAVFYLPTILPTVVTVYIWRYLLNAQYGFVNEVLSFFGQVRPLWLDDATWTKPAVLLIGFWAIGQTAVIYLAALQDVPEELKEAAEVDGAGPVRRFLVVVWPTLSPVTLFNVVVLTIGHLMIFAQPYLFAQTPGGGAAGYNIVSGGPDNSLLTYAMYIYQNAFVFLKMGYASTLAWVLFFVISALTLIILRSSRRWVHYGN